MAELFDTFNGPAGDLTWHTADSGERWGPGGDTGHCLLDGSGNVYNPGNGPAGDMPLYSSWKPPGADYAALVVLGSQWRAGARSKEIGIGPAVRCSGARPSISAYGLWVGNDGTDDTVCIGALYAGASTALESTVLERPLQASDVIELRVLGRGILVTLMALINGELILYARAASLRSLASVWTTRTRATMLPAWETRGETHEGARLA